jgi:uncharacterized coiled-coil DUF342 family protein
MKKKLLPIFIYSILISGCGSQISCSSGEAKNLVQEISKENGLLSNVHLLSASFGKIASSRSQKQHEEAAQIDAEIMKIRDSQQTIRVRVSALSSECKDSVIKSPMMTQLEREVSLMGREIEELQNEKPRAPPPFSWAFTGTPTLEQHKQRSAALEKHRAAQNAYEQEFQNLRNRVASQERELLKRVSTIRMSLQFLNESCNNIMQASQEKRTFTRGSVYSRTTYSSIDVNKMNDIEKNLSLYSEFNNISVPKAFYEQISTFGQRSLAAEIKSLNETEDEIFSISSRHAEKVNLENANREEKIKTDLANSSYELSDIVTVGKNDATGNFSCKAVLRAKFGDSEVYQSGITYLVERTSDKKPFVTVTGLR